MKARLLLVLLVLGATRVAFASAPLTPGLRAPAPPDVTLHEPAQRRTVLSVQWNPLALFLARVSFDVVVTPVDHHALVLSPFFTWPKTQALYYNTQDAAGMSLTVGIPSVQIYGGGGELGYRYYTGTRGPRGFFLGPSFIFGLVSAKPQGDVAGATPGNAVTFVDLGGALDIGWAAVVAERVSFTVGAGAQFMSPLQSIPTQQFPASVIANPMLLPRFLLNVGYSF